MVEATKPARADKHHHVLKSLL